MSVLSFEGVVEKGHIRLPADLELPDSTTVYVLVPAVETGQARVLSPRLACPEQATDFVKQVARADDDAGL